MLPKNVLSRYGLEDAVVSPIVAGHLNATFKLEQAGRKVIIQRLNRIFGAEIHDDIEAVTRHLAKKGVTTPLLVPTTTGELFTRDGENMVYRVFTFVEGVTYLKAQSARQCHAAAMLLGRFHTALADLKHTFKNKRGNIHDTARHGAMLRGVLDSHRTHDCFADIAPVGREILARLDALPALHLPKRIAHGDPKISNIIFDTEGAAVCLVDLDTLFPANIGVELGDALRSWCNPLVEDDTASTIDLKYFDAAVRGYLEGARQLITRAEAEMITVGVETIALELAARFAADALEESYFGWDRSRFTRAAEHNLARARGQLAVAASMATQSASAKALIRNALADNGID